MYKVGIFGTGKLGKLHLDHWKQIPGVVITGFYDPIDAAAAEVESHYGVRRYASEEALINDSDIIDVASPTPSHFAICEKALRKGRHVFVEKPMTHTMNEAEQLVKLVQESSVKLQVGHCERFNPALVPLKDMELAPMFIEVQRQTGMQAGGGNINVVLDLMIHDIDTVLSLVKSEVKQISASGVAVLNDTADIVNARIEFNNGCVANLTSSRIARKPVLQMLLFQKDIYADIDFLVKETEIIRRETPTVEKVSLFEVDEPEEFRGPMAANPLSPDGNAIGQELLEFVKAIRNNTRTVVNEIDGYRAMEVAHQILKKITTNLPTAR